MNLNDMIRDALRGSRRDIGDLDHAILNATDRTLDIPDYDEPQYLTGEADEIIEIALDAESDELYVVADPSVRSADFEMLLDAICNDLPRLGEMGFEALARRAWGDGGCSEDEARLLDKALGAAEVTGDDDADTEDVFDIPCYAVPTGVRLRDGEYRTVIYRDGAFECAEEGVVRVGLRSFLTILAEKIAYRRGQPPAEARLVARLRAALRARGVTESELAEIER